MEMLDKFAAYYDVDISILFYKNIVINMIITVYTFCRTLRKFTCFLHFLSHVCSKINTADLRKSLKIQSPTRKTGGWLYADVPVSNIAAVSFK